MRVKGIKVLQIVTSKVHNASDHCNLLYGLPKFYNNDIQISL